MMLTTSSQIATAFGLTESELLRQALAAFLQQKKCEILQLRLAVLSRYGARSPEDLEAKIAERIAVEHLAREDLITVKNLMARVGGLDGYLDDLRTAER